MHNRPVDIHIPPAPRSPEEVWDAKVDKVISAINFRANVYLFLGMSVYGLGTAIILFFIKDWGFATVLVMFFFQLLVIYFGSQVMYPCIGGAFRIGILANRETVPVFEKMNTKLESADGRMEQAALDIREAGDKIHVEVKRLADSMDRPIETPRRRLVGPPIPVEASDGGNGTSENDE